MQLSSVRRNPIARNEDRQKLTQNCDFTGPVATLSHEMQFDRQKLTQNCDFHGSGRNLFARNEIRSPKTGKKNATFKRPAQPYRAK